MDPEAVDSIAAALRREHGVRGVMGLAKVPTGALLASGVPRWKVNALVAEIQKMRLGTRGALAPTLGAARAGQAGPRSTNTGDSDSLRLNGAGQQRGAACSGVSG